jgi:hypothetical protein
LSLARNWWVTANVPYNIKVHECIESIINGL